MNQRAGIFTTLCFTGSPTLWLSDLEPIRKPALRPERERAGCEQGARSSRIARYGDAAQRRAQPVQPREAQMRFSDRLLTKNVHTSIRSHIHTQSMPGNPHG